MYLTRFRLNTARRQANRLLTSPHRIHGAVSMSFPELSSRSGEGPRVLWRVDRNSPAETVLFIVSPQRPDLTHLVEQAGWPSSDTPGWTTYAYGDFLNSLKTGDSWSFRLTANPVRSLREVPENRAEEGPRLRGKPVPHVTPRHQMAWLLARQKQAGFEVVRKPEEKRLTPDDEHELRVLDRSPLKFSRGPQGDGAPKKKDSRVQFHRVTFHGRLRVADPVALRRTLTHGLGREKAYGCGLMTLAPVS